MKSLVNGEAEIMAIAGTIEENSVTIAQWHRDVYGKAFRVVARATEHPAPGTQGAHKEGRRLAESEAEVTPAADEGGGYNMQPKGRRR